VFLIEKRGVTINRNSYDRYFSANLWGTLKVADRDAAIIFHNIAYDRNGKVSEAEYNFVEKGEFELIYSVIK